MDTFVVIVTLAGLAALGAAIVPRLLAGRWLSFPIVYLGGGMLVFLLPLGIPQPDPLEQGVLFERLAELGVIVALMGVGLKLDRPVGRRSWASVWGLLAVTMPLTIVAVALLGWWMAGLAPAAAVLLAAVIAPTDPVLAADVQVERPFEGTEEEVRFALTGEAGLNDGLAFPFANAAVAMAAVGAAPALWLADWAAVDVVYRLAVGIAGGYVLGGLLAEGIFRLLERDLVDDVSGFVALAATLLVYGATELLGGYGFLAVFLAALRLRHHEGSRHYHRTLHRFAEELERLFVAALLVLLGGAVTAGVLGALSWQGALVGLLLLFVIRPLAGMAGLVGSVATGRQRAVIALFGIRGMGSIYYLAYGLNAASFAQAAEIWAIVAFVILTSVVLHGIASTPLMRAVDGR